MTAIMAKRNRPLKSAENPLDMFSTKRGRGRPVKVVPSAVVGRADNYRGILPMIWDELEAPLLKAQTEEEVVKAFQVAQSRGARISFAGACDFQGREKLEFSKEAKSTNQFLSGFHRGSWAGHASQITRYLRRRESIKIRGPTSPSHYSVRVLRGMFLRLQRTFREPRLS